MQQGTDNPLSKMAYSGITVDKMAYPVITRGQDGVPSDNRGQDGVLRDNQGWGQVQYLYLVLVLKYIFSST